MTDLHLHTTASDGQFSPSETIRMAWEAGVRTVAVTDHDTVLGVAEAATAAAQYGMQFFSGIEISVKGAAELHILGYGVDPKNPKLLAFCREQEQNRKDRIVRMLEYLKKCGAPLTQAEVEQANNGKATGRPHFARALVQKGYVASVQEAFDRYLTTPEYDRTVERPKPTPADGIAVLQQAGGVAVLAHPYLLHLEEAELAALLVQLKSLGLKGIEAYYSRHTQAQTALYLRLAAQEGLIVTCGSDFHGPGVKPDIAPGTGIHGNLRNHDPKIPSELQRAIHNSKQNS